MDLLDRIEFWHWWVVAALLVAVEVFAPSTILLWPAAAAAIVGVILLAAPDLGWDYQVLLFAVLSVASLAVWRVYLRRHPTETDDPGLNRRAEQIVGRRFTLDTGIVNGEGKLRVDDTTWKVTGEDLEPGARVEVTGVEGVILKVGRV